MCTARKSNSASGVSTGVLAQTQGVRPRKAGRSARAWQRRLNIHLATDRFADIVKAESWGAPKVPSSGFHCTRQPTCGHTAENVCSTPFSSLYTATLSLPACCTAPQPGGRSSGLSRRPGTTTLDSACADTRALSKWPCRDDQRCSCASLRKCGISAWLAASCNCPPDGSAVLPERRHRLYSACPQGSCNSWILGTSAVEACLPD